MSETAPITAREALVEQIDALLSLDQADALYSGRLPGLARQLLEDALSALSVQLAREGLRAAMREACDLLAERIYGNPARSPGHNARVLLEAALSAAPAPVETGWQDIASAPRDGTPILVRRDNGCGWDHAIVWWSWAEESSDYPWQADENAYPGDRFDDWMPIPGVVGQIPSAPSTGEG